MIRRQRVFGYTFEELRVLIGPMAKDAVEPVGAMGVDTPIAVLSDKPKLLYSYFKQLFAQVTNPAIDAYREELITDTRAQLGSEKDIINPSADSCRKIELDHPFLTNKSLKKIKYIDNEHFKSELFPILFNPKRGGKGLQESLKKLFEKVDTAISKGVNIIILSDRGFDKERCPIPALLGGSGLNHHLIKNGNRMKVSIVI